MNPTFRIPTAPTPSLWPTTKAGVIDVARDWYNPARVAINLDAIARLPAGTIEAPGETNFTLPIGERPLRESVAFCVAVNAINHMFWKVEDGQFIRYGQNGQIGALAMTDAFQKAWANEASPIRRAVDAGIPLSAGDVVAIFGDIPDVDGRVTILNEVLTHEGFWGICAELESAMDMGAIGTAEAARLAEVFPVAYGDGVLKKAQLAVSAVWRAGMSETQKMGTAPIACELTAFADYQIPNVLRAMGILDYAPDLAGAIDSQQPIGENSVDERALRGAAILAVEKLARAQGRHVADVDYWLWLNRKAPTTPFHLTVTNAY
jgi:hypothetical protein